MREFVWRGLRCKFAVAECRVNANVKLFELARIPGRRSIWTELNSRIIQGVASAPTLALLTASAGPAALEAAREAFADIIEFELESGLFLQVPRTAAVGGEAGNARSHACRTRKYTQRKQVANSWG